MFVTCRMWDTVLTAVSLPFYLSGALTSRVRKGRIGNGRQTNKQLDAGEDTSLNCWRIDSPTWERRMTAKRAEFLVWTKEITAQTDFDVLLTVHLSIFILVIIQLDAQNSFNNKFISCLYMFRAPRAHRQEVTNCIIQYLVSSHSVGGRPVHRLTLWRCLDPDVR